MRSVQPVTSVRLTSTQALTAMVVCLLWAACFAGASAAAVGSLLAAPANPAPANPAPAGLAMAGPASAGPGAASATPASVVPAGAAPRLAFARNGDIWTIAADGGGLKQLTSGSSYESAPAWSPGRGTLAYLSRPHASSSKLERLWVMRSDGSNRRRLAYVGPSLAGGSSSLAYSPHGGLLAGGAKLAAQNEWAVTVLDLKARTSRIVYRYTSAGGVESLTWSPDGRQLVATIEYGGTYGMVRIDVTRDRLVDTHGTRNVESASWRPDGKFLLCSKWFPTVSGGPYRTILMKPDGTKVKTLGENQRFPVYAPDGSQYAFIEYVENSTVLKRAAADGSGITTILAAEDIWGAAWR